MTILYFTATGNSLYVAKSLGAKTLSIPQIIKEGKYEFSDDKIGIVFPVFGWEVSSLVADFLKKAKFNTEYLFAVATYGIFPGSVAKHLTEISAECDFEFSYINAVLMVDNWLPGFNMKEQMESEHKKEIEMQIAKIKSDIQNDLHYVLPYSFSEELAKKYGFEFFEEKRAEIIINGINDDIFVEESCNGCSVCVKVCPVDNIKLEEEHSKISLDNRCFSCYSCIQNCPQNAIHLKNEKDRSRFRNKNVSLDEIINSNI